MSRIGKLEVENVKAKSATGRNALLVSLLASGLSLAMPVLALAEEGGGGFSLLIPKMGEFIPTLIAFIIIWIILAKVGWPMITGMLDEREKTIKDSLEQAEQAKIQSEQLLAEHKAQLDEARVEAAQIIANAKEAGEALKADITAKAQQESADMIAKAHLAIEAEKKAAIADLQSSVADLSVSVAGRLIGENLSDDEHLKLIERYVAEAGSLDAN
jgi:F-type H+-transporting ATPase subunit b